MKEAQSGSTVVSTIDLQIQSIVEKHILAFNEEPSVRTVQDRIVRSLDAAVPHVPVYCKSKHMAGQSTSSGDRYSKIVLDQQQYGSRTIPFKRGDYLLFICLSELAITPSFGISSYCFT